MRTFRLLSLLFAGLAASGWLWADKNKKSEERLLKEKIEDLNELSERLNRYAVDEVETPEREFVHERIVTLLQRARKEPPGYVYERLEDAIDDLLDASDDIGDAFTDAPDDDDTQERSARRLESAYFDLHQGEYFANQSQEPDAAAYVRTAKRLYQQARNCHDEGNFQKARDLAAAAREIVAALENLAHAAVRVPTPPRL